MSTSPAFVAAVLDAFGARDVRVRAMFGEYGLYCEDKMVGLVCEDTLFLKVTEPGKLFAPELATASPYPGAKEQFVIPEDTFPDARWMHEMLRITWDALPAPKPKKKS